MKKTYDFTLLYPCYPGCLSWCRVRVYGPDPERSQDAGKPPVVVATEQDNNPGTSITNRIEVIVSIAYCLLGCPNEGITVIEHYKDRAFIGGRPLLRARVEMDWDRRHGFRSPKWFPLTEGTVETLLGENL